MARDPRELYQKLLSVASNHGASDGERAQAREYMRRLVEQHGDSIKAWTRLVLTPETPHEAQLALHTAATHKCRMTQELPNFIVEGPPEAVEKVRLDYKVYAKHLSDILSLAMIAALKGMGVYNESPGGPTKESKPAFPYAVQNDVANIFGAAQHIGRAFRRPDYTLKQLPAPKPKQWAVADPTDPDYVPERFRGMGSFGTQVIGGREMQVRGNVTQEFIDMIFGVNGGGKKKGT